MTTHEHPTPEYDPADATQRRPFSLSRWIDDHREELTRRSPTSRCSARPT